MKICDSPLEKREREREMELLKADRGELNKQSSALGRKEARRRREAKNGRERERERKRATAPITRDRIPPGRVGWGTLRESRLLTQS
jgi:transcription elongation GreA/GreB family factor